MTAAVSLSPEPPGPPGPPETEDWWRDGVIYQIYPRSFQDADGDGVGDLKGVLRRLPYLVELGVDILWLSPIFPSPMADFGYDVADYCAVDPLFGSLEDLDGLIAACHAHGLRLLLDYVPNHTSDRHPWFLESRSSRTAPKRDWYIWRDPKPDGGPPNNWISDFGGSSWTFDAASGQFYLHAFLPQQPDLNWRNPRVREAMMQVLRFWLDRGVDGFRMDVLWHIFKAEDLPDNPANPDYRPGMGEMHKLLQLHSTDQPEVHAAARDMRRIADSYPGGRLLIGEIYLPFERLMTYYGAPEAPETQMPFNFTLIEAEWSAGALRALIGAYEAALPSGGWPNWVLGNHDRPRIADRVGEAQARVAAMMLLTLRGTPTLYYGDELGVGRVDIPADAVVDPRERRQPGLGLGRDPVRTPMAWAAEPQGGFTSASPWLPLHDDWPLRNVESQSRDPASMLVLHKSLLSLRRTSAALRRGALRLLETVEGVLAYERRWGSERVIVALNLTDKPQQRPAEAAGLHEALSTAPASKASVGCNAGELLANEGIIMTSRVDA